ncbi:phosphopantetheine-binding protein [Nocardiopsis sp. NPDC006198]|uniref:phosphopantetheine-binding protein n=1 Tax=Nocardiopsis sp. NPDC006198 TaxID=3154472 RepID=UPI0033A13730
MGSDVRAITDEEVLGVVISGLPGFRNTEQLTPQSDLWAAGMDSLSNISVMVAIEGEFGIEFPDEFLTPEVFASAANIAEAVRAILGGRTG